MEKGSGETRDTAADYDRAASRDDRELDREDDDSDDNEDRDSARVERDRSREVDADAGERRYTPPSRDGGHGILDLQIEPADASVYIDGEFFGKASQLSRVELAPGRHRIEVVRPGYKTEETEVEVGGEAKRVVVKLGRR